MKSSLYFRSTVLGLLILYGSGQPSITSTLQPLSGELCPGAVTFYCNWLDTDSAVIDFYNNDTSLVKYMFSTGLTSVPSGFMAEIVSAEFSSVNRKHSYMNFTLSANLADLISYQGQNISCGTVTIRSTSIYIGNYTIKDFTSISSEQLNIRFSVVYVGLELMLSEIIVLWDDLTFSDDCLRNISYKVKLTNQDTKQNDTYNCNNMTCSATFLLGNEKKESDIFTISVTASSDSQNFSSGQISLDTSIANVFTIHNDTDNCKQKIVCPSNDNDNCFVQYQESESSLFESLKVDQEWAINFSTGKLVYLNITRKIGSNRTFIAQIYYKADDPRRNYNDFVGVGVVLMILGFIFEIVGNAIVVHWVIKKFSYTVCLWVLLLGVLWLLTLLSLSLWISFGVLTSSRSCVQGPEGDIVITATVLSVVLVIVSVLVTSSFILYYKCKRKRPTKEEYQLLEEPLRISYDIEYKLYFGNEYTIKVSDASVSTHCKCGARFSDIKGLKDLPFAMSKDTVKKRKCRACPKNMCNDCLRYAFMKQTLAWEQVCKDCYTSYEEEREKILNHIKVGVFEPIKEKYGDICYECLHGEEKLEVENCKGCGQCVCNNCIVMKEQVYLTYSNTSEHVCRNCYALFNIMQGNPNSKNIEVNDDGDPNSKKEEVVEVNDDGRGETQHEIMQGNPQPEHKEEGKLIASQIS